MICNCLKQQNKSWASVQYVQKKKSIVCKPLKIYDDLGKINIKAAVHRAFGNTLLMLILCKIE